MTLLVATSDTRLVLEAVSQLLRSFLRQGY